MSYSIRLTRAAEQDLDDIFAYIALALQAPQNAAGQLERLERGIASLDSLPGRFRVYEREPWKSRGLRLMPVDQYLVFYIPDFEMETVTVLRIMYSGRNAERHL
ncbi:MAG: type II toxin-antitoxin system RelE/ParE family toxin [Clostridia bacterium]|nr:type II toxin-antitoxin system RelE/ParE family toxin [Clostridia bacterium]MBQ6427105.1 type II toxin-antitoxin system RelE/ParE family toxin [Clostridia bacterium]MBR0445435.1 type II toxin-antitoxin system RelE/ParE family toxin [Clostridia bacterium]